MLNDVLLIVGLLTHRGMARLSWHEGGAGYISAQLQQHCIVKCTDVIDVYFTLNISWQYASKIHKLFDLFNFYIFCLNLHASFRTSFTLFLWQIFYCCSLHCQYRNRCTSLFLLLNQCHMQTRSYIGAQNPLQLSARSGDACTSAQSFSEDASWLPEGISPLFTYV